MKKLLCHASLPVLLLLFLVTGCATTSSRWDEETASDIIARGDEAVSQKKYGDAASEFRRAYTRDPQSRDAYLKAAAACVAQEKYQDALDHYDQALKNLTDKSGIARARARLVYKLKQPVIAVLPMVNGNAAGTDDYMAVGTQDQLTVNLYYLHAFRTIALPGIVDQFKPEPLEKLRITDQDAERVSAALKADLLIFGSFSGMQGKQTVQLKLYDAAAREILVTETADIHGEPSVLAAAFLRLLDAVDTPISPEERRRILSPTSSNQAAIRANALGFEKLVRKNPDQGAAGEDLGQAIGILTEAVALDPAYAEACNNLGWGYVEQKDYDKALQAFDRALAIKGELVDAIAGKGYALLQRGKDGTAAVIQLRKALELNPALYAHHVYLGDALGALGNWQEALSAYEKASLLNPDNPWVHARVGQALSALGRNEQAVARYDRALSLHTESDQLYANRGVVLFMLKEYGKCAADFQNAARLAPTNPEYYADAARCLGKNSNPEGAVEYFTKAIEKSAAPNEYLKERAAAYIRMKHLDKARADLEALQKKGILDPDAERLTGDILLAEYAETGKKDSLDQAAVIYERNYEKQPKQEGKARVLFRFMNAAYLNQRWDTVAKLSANIDELGAMPECRKFMLAQMYDVQDKKEEAKAQLRSALQDDRTLACLFGGEDLVLNGQNRQFLLALINQERGFVNLSFLQWKDLLFEHLPTDFSIFSAVFGHLAELAKFRDDLQRYMVYERDNTIYRYDFLSEEQKRLAQGRHPVWSPDKTRIAFVRDGGPSLHVMDWDGGNEVCVREQLNSGHTYDASTYGNLLSAAGDFGWSKDGLSLIYGHSARPGSASGIVTLDRGTYPLYPVAARVNDYDGGLNLTRTSTGDGYNMKWTIWNNGQELLRYALDDAIVSWRVSKDGKALIYTQNNRVFSKEINGGAPNLVFNPAEYEETIDLPIKEYFADRYGNIQEKDSKRAYTVSAIKGLGSGVSWGYTNDMALLSWERLEKLDTRKEETIDRSRGYAKVWVEPVERFSDRKLILYTPSSKRYIEIGNGENADWMPYSHYGILVEQAKSELRDKGDALINRMFDRMMADTLGTATDSKEGKSKDTREAPYNKFVPVPAKADRRTITDLLAAGFRQIQSGKIDEARATFNKIIAKNDTQAEAYIGLAITHAIGSSKETISSDNFEKAFQYVMKAIDIYPKPEYFFVQGWLTLIAGSIEKNYAEHALTVSWIDMLCVALFATETETDLKKIQANYKVAYAALDSFKTELADNNRTKDKDEYHFSKKAFLAAVTGLDFAPPPPAKSLNRNTAR